MRYILNMIRCVLEIVRLGALSSAQPQLPAQAEVDGLLREILWFHYLFEIANHNSEIGWRFLKRSEILPISVIANYFYYYYFMATAADILDVVYAVQI